MDLQEINQKKMYGDFTTVSKMVDLTPSNAFAALQRPDSKHHTKVSKALTMVIQTREQLLAQKIS